MIRCQISIQHLKQANVLPVYVPFGVTLIFMIFSIVSVVPWPHEGSGTVDMLGYVDNSCVSTRRAKSNARQRSHALLCTSRDLFMTICLRKVVCFIRLFLSIQDSTDELTNIIKRSLFSLFLFGTIFLLLSFIITLQHLCAGKQRKYFANYRCHWRCPAFTSTLAANCSWKWIRITSLAQHGISYHLCEWVNIVSLWIMLNPYFVFVGRGCESGSQKRHFLIAMHVCASKLRLNYSNTNKQINMQDRSK